MGAAKPPVPLACRRANDCMRTKLFRVVADKQDPFRDNVDQGLAARGRGELPVAIRHFRAACDLRPELLGPRCELALTLFRKGDLDEAEALYRHVLEKDRRSASAMAGLGRISQRRADGAAAVAYFADALAVVPNNAGLRSELGNILRELGRLDEAEETFKQALAVEPDHRPSLTGLGLLCRQRGYYAPAIIYLRQALHQLPEDAGLKCALAATLFQKGDLDEAEALYRSVLGKDRQNAGAMAALGHISRRKGDRDAAIAHFNDALAVAPTLLGLKSQLGDVLREASRFAEAEEIFKQILVSDPTHQSSLSGLGFVCRQRGDHASSATYFQRAVEQHPQHAGLKCELAASLREMNRLDEAEALYHSALTASPGHAGALLGLSHMARRRGRFDQAIALLINASAGAPSDVNLRIHLSASYRDLGRTEEALAAIQDALSQAPDNAHAWIELGQIRRAQDRLEEALQAFLEAARFAFERGMIEAAWEYRALGRPYEARGALEAVLDRTPGEYGAILRLAELEVLGEDFESCIRLCDRLIADYPQRIPPYLLKCRALIQLDQAEQAIALAVGLENIVPASPELDAAKLEILRASARYGDVAELLESSREAAAGDFRLWTEWVVTQLAFDRYSELHSMLAVPPAVRPFERSRVHYIRGVLADQRWRLTEAVAEFQRALTLGPQDAGAHSYLARLHFLLIDPEQTASHLAAQIERDSSGVLLRSESTNISQNLTGQLLTELRLDRQLLAKLAVLRGQSPERQARLALEIVSAHPNATPPAIYLLLALRQADFFEREIDPSECPAIPRNIMQYWDKATPPSGIAALMTGWRDSHPDFKYVRFNKADARAYLREHYPDAVVQAYRRASHAAQASDVFRLAYLYREGGYYIDADDRCLGHLSEITGGDAEFIAYQEQYATLGNNFLACVPGEPVMGRALDLAVAALNRGDADTIWLATGPGLMTRAFAQLLAEQGSDPVRWRRWLATRYVLERATLKRVSSPHSASGYKKTRQSWLRSTFKSRSTDQRAIRETAGAPSF